MLAPIPLPQNYNYIGVFLSLSCNLSCSYCINHLVGLNQKRKQLSGKQWVEAINRIQNDQNVPISLQGGEPSIHKDFYEIINGIKKEHPVDLLTNIQFDPKTFMQQVSPERFLRDLPYPAIRVSYHPETMDLKETLNKVKVLHDNGYSIGVFTVEHPDAREEVSMIRKACENQNIFFKTKPFLGTHHGKIYGEYLYPDSVFNPNLRTVQCKTTELLISPEGEIYRCHHDLYNKKEAVGDILNSNFLVEDIFRPCEYYGRCNPCDVKLKNNRYQKFGHCSVEIQAS